MNINGKQHLKSNIKRLDVLPYLCHIIMHLYIKQFKQKVFMKQLTLFNYVELRDNFSHKRYIRFTYKNHRFFRAFHLGKSYLENTILNY